MRNLWFLETNICFNVQFIPSTHGIALFVKKISDLSNNYAIFFEIGFWRCAKQFFLTFETRFSWPPTVGNQIYLVTFMCLTVDTSFTFTKKNQTLQNVFFYLECWDSTVLPKIRGHFNNKIILKLKLSKIYFTKNVVLNWYS